LKFVLASNNAKKTEEMRRILFNIGAEVLSLREAGICSAPEETGSTFYENARIKAAAACAASGLPSIADDSGLCVEALGGEPGVYSARYAGENASDEELCACLLARMDRAENRRAEFVSTLVCVFPNGDELSARGECPGEILRAARGSGGFGYDPVFLVKGAGKTMAEMTAEEKDAVSHRGAAMRKFGKKLADYLADKGRADHVDK